jgi:hypothetical protein
VTKIDKAMRVAQSVLLLSNNVACPARLAAPDIASDRTAE